MDQSSLVLISGLFNHSVSTCQLCLASSPRGPGPIVPPFLFPFPPASLVLPQCYISRKGSSRTGFRPGPHLPLKKHSLCPPASTHHWHTLPSQPVPLPVENSRTWSVRETHVYPSSGALVLHLLHTLPKQREGCEFDASLSYRGRPS